MDFRVLGPLALVDGDREVSLGSPHQRRLLAALLLRAGHSVSTDALVDAVWGEAPPPTAATTIQSYVSRLRRALPDGSLRRTGPGYRLVVDREHVDAARFEERITRARSAASGAEAIALLDAALALWRGDAYPDLAHDDSGRAEATRLAELRELGREERAEALLAAGRTADAVAELHALTAAQPLRERPWRLLMLALHRTGRQAEALAAYRRYERHLADQGLEPAAAMQGLQTALLTVPESLRTSPEPPEPAPAARPALPRPAAALIGREADLAALVRLLRTGALVSVVGPAGVGKSRLAVEAARVVADGHLDGACLVPLDSVPDATGVVPAVAERLGAVTSTGSLASALVGRDLLLVLDGAEHVLDATAALAAELVSHCPGVVTLVTSQERLGVDGEQVWPLRPLDAAAPESPAVRLFVDRATAANPAFAPDPAGLAAITALCGHLDGLPLAVEMAAARTTAYSPAELLERLDRRFSLLRGVRAAAGSRHETLRAAVDWSYRLLDVDERAVLTGVAMFPASFDADAAAAVCGRDPDEVRELLSRLVERSMVVADVRAERSRFRLLETVRTYGVEVLRAQGGHAALRGRHAGWVVRHVEAADERLRGPDEVAARATLEAALDDLRVAHAWSLESRDGAAAARIATAVFGCAYYQLVLEPTDWAAAAVRTFGEDAPAAALALAGLGLVFRGDLSGGEALARAALARLDAPPRARWMAAQVLADAAVYGGQPAEALPRSAETLASDDPLTRAEGHQTSGIAAAYLGDLDAARRHAAALRELAARTGAPTIAAWADYLTGETLVGTDPATALTHLDAAFALARDAGNRLVEGVSLVAATACRVRHGEPAQALAAVATAAGHWYRQGDWPHQWPTLRTAAILLSRLGDHSTAVTLAAAVAANGPPAYGAEAADLAVMTEAARTAVDVDAATAAGARLGPVDAVQLALRAIAAHRSTS